MGNRTAQRCDRCNRRTPRSHLHETRVGVVCSHCHDALPGHLRKQVAATTMKEN